MNRLGLLIPLAFISQAYATTEDDEAMNQLMDTLVNGDSNTTDQLVDMISEKLVNKLLGFTAMLTQPAQAVPAAQVRQFMQTPQVQFGGAMQAPDLQVNVGLSPPQVQSGGGYDNSKNVKLGEEREGVVKSRNKNYNSIKDSAAQRWGVGVTSNGRSANPYAVSYPDNAGRDTALADTSKIKMVPRYKPGPEYQNFGSAEYEKLQGKAGFGAARDLDKGLPGLQGDAANPRFDGGNRPKLMEMDETDGPDAVSIIATFLLSAFVGSAFTFAMVRFRQGTKTGMRAPLLM